MWSSTYPHKPFLYAAFLIALSAGFGYGASLVLARAWGVLLGTWYSAVVQAHGHAQLFGWVGLFVLGVGLNVLPKMRGTTLKRVERLPYAWGLLVMGIVLRSVVQPIIGFWGTGEVWRALLLLSAILEMAGISVVVSMLLATERAERQAATAGTAVPGASPARKIKPRAEVLEVEPFAQLAFLSLALAFLFNLLGIWNLVSQGKTVLAPRYDQLIILLMVYGVALPMIFAFAIRTLPLFMRLPLPPRGIWRTLALLYFVGLVLRALPNLLAIADDALILTGRILRANFVNVLIFDALAIGGVLLLNGCILVFIWQLQLTRRRPSNAPVKQSSRSEYGRFEFLIYSAFVWLVVASLLDVMLALPVINERIEIPQDAARHALVLGGITLLIFGMAVRLLPGLSGKRGLAHPQSVLWIFVLGNLAALLRVVPLFFFDSEWAGGLVGLSGILGWSALLLLAIEVWLLLRSNPSGK